MRRPSLSDPRVRAPCQRLTRGRAPVMGRAWSRRDAATAGVILAGGRASRMGGRDKAFAAVDGEPIAVAHRSPLPAICSRRSSSRRTVPSASRGFGVETVADRLPGLRAARRHPCRHARRAATRTIFVVACDMPGLDADVIRLLLARSRAGGRDRAALGGRRRAAARASTPSARCPAIEACLARRPATRCATSCPRSGSTTWARTSCARSRGAARQPPQREHAGGARRASAAASRRRSAERSARPRRRAGRRRRRRPARPDRCRHATRDARAPSPAPQHVHPRVRRAAATSSSTCAPRAKDVYPVALGRVRRRRARRRRVFDDGRRARAGRGARRRGAARASSSRSAGRRRARSSTAWSTARGTTGRSGSSPRRSCAASSSRRARIAERARPRARSVPTGSPSWPSISDAWPDAAATALR